MTLLLPGVLLFALVHFIPSLAPALKSKVVQRLGEGPYKGIFSLLLASFGLIIAGWRSTAPTPVYTPLPALHDFALAVLALAFLLLVASTRKSRLRRVIRHPQLTGVALWGGSHLLLNGRHPVAAVVFGHDTVGSGRDHRDQQTRGSLDQR